MNQGGTEKSEPDPLAFLAGGDEMGQRIRAFDWSKTPVGPVADWPQSLRTAVSICLGSRHPIVIWWGKEVLTQFYNDAYIPILGITKHPGWLGRSGRECWSDIWPVMGPMWESVFATGQATWSEDFLYVLDRNIPQEEGYFTFSYSPILDDAGTVGGIFCACNETTGRVIGERRLRTLRDLGRTVAEAKTAADACAIATQTLAANPADIPFALIYLLDAEGQQAHLTAMAGVKAGSGSALDQIDLRESTERSRTWPLRQVFETTSAELVTDLVARFGSLPGGPWPESPEAALILPIAAPGLTRPTGFLVTGLSPRRVWDADYRSFFDLISSHISTAIANARAYEEERKRAEALAELDRAKTAFFSNVSHEFRTPLTLMLGPVEDLLARSHTTDLSPAARGHLEVVNRNGLRLLRLVNTLLDFSRIEAGRVRAVYQPTDLAAFTADLASVFRSACERAGLQLTVDCPPLSKPVFVDRQMWEKIVLNLLSNAFKFTFEGEIAVTLRPIGESGVDAPGDRYAELRIRDTGTGIPTQEMPHLFERFHRIENVRGRTHEGSGIGLALVQELIKLHGGSIAAESVAGQGTTFRVLVPLGSAHLPSNQIGKGDPLASAGTVASPYVEEALRWLPDEVRDDDNLSELPAYPETPPVSYQQAKQADGDDRLRVLVADDNADMRQYLVHLLAERYRVEAVPDGEAALAAARERPPDLILTDVMMPRMDGFGLLRELQADPHTSGLPVILLSARAGEESRVEGMEAGADDYLIKPFSARELLARVGALLQINRLRRESEHAIRQSEERFRVLFETMSEGFVITEVLCDEAGHAYDLRCLEANPAFERHTGLKRSDVLGRTTLELFPDAEPLWFERGGQVAATGVPSHFQAKFGPLGQWFEVSAYRTGPKQIAAVFFNITEQKRADDALKEADRRKDEFLATLAHELRNPLAPLRNGLQVMKLARNDGDAVEQTRAMMERQLGQLVHLVDDLLDVSRISRGKIELRKERVELAKVVQQAVETSRPLLESGDHDLTINVPSEPIYVDADVTRLAEVFSNLLNNAAKYTERGGRVKLTIERQGGDAVVSVRDTGIGIPAPMLPKVFEMFTQVDRSLERSQGGLGIGLSLVKWLVEMHGGSVEARSEGRGMGSEFLVRLPIILSASVEQPSDAAELPRPAVRHRILVVDDNRDSAVSLAKMLQIMGNETQTAHDGLEALNVAAAFRPDVVMLDIGMPELNGYSAARRIRQEPWGKDAMLVALTGWGQEEDRRRSQEAGFDLHIVKPVEPATLEKMLARAESPKCRA